MPAKVGTGSTVTFATSLFSMGITSIDGPAIARETLQTSVMSTTGFHAKIPTTLLNVDTLTLSVFHDVTVNPLTALQNTGEVITIVLGGASTGLYDTWVGTGHMESYTPSAELEGVMTGEAVVSFQGAITTA